MHRLLLGRRVNEASHTAPLEHKKVLPLRSLCVADEPRVLAQPLGRLVAAFAIGLPTGSLFVICGIELAVGLALLLLRPQGRLLSS